MSTDLPARQLSYREARYIRKVMFESKSRSQAMRELGFPPGLCEHPAMIESPEILAEMERLRGELVKNALEGGLIDAAEIHEYLTDALRARMSDIRNDDHTYKPRSEWPDIWDRMEDGGEVEVKYEAERSHDGQDKENRGGWDTTGKVVSVKMKFPSKVKLLELAMKHKGVDAMVQAKSDTNINITVTAQQQRIARAKRRLETIIDVKPES